MPFAFSVVYVADIQSIINDKLALSFAFSLAFSLRFSNKNSRYDRIGYSLYEEEDGVISVSSPRQSVRAGPLRQLQVARRGR